MTPADKLAVLERGASVVRERLRAMVDNDALWDEVLVVARARHVLGHYEYGDSNLFEWSDGKVQAATLEELADAAVYQAWLVERRRFRERV